MIAAAGSSISADVSRPSVSSAQPVRSPRLTIEIEAAGPRRTAAAPEPRRLATGLQALLTDGAPGPRFDRARAAARAFTAGDGFIPGQIVDRTI